VFLGCIVVDVLVFPAIAEVGFEAVEANEATFVDKTVTFRRLLVMLMDLWQAVVEVELLVVDGVIKGQLHQLKLRENLF
jgi:hypothetical protein